MHGILTNICEGQGQEGDIETLEDLSEVLTEASLCGLGQSAANPFQSTLRYFRDEYEAHINQKRCPALSCKGLVSFWIDPDKCTACMLCLKKCPAQSIEGGKKQIHVIDQQACDACGACFEVCPDKFDAVKKISGEPVPDPLPLDKRAYVKGAK